MKFQRDPGFLSVTVQFSSVTQSCLTLCNLMDYAVHGIFQTRILEWVALPSPGDLPAPEIEPASTALQADPFPAEQTGKPLFSSTQFNRSVMSDSLRPHEW